MSGVPYCADQHEQQREGLGANGRAAEPPISATPGCARYRQGTSSRRLPVKMMSCETLKCAHAHHEGEHQLAEIVEEAGRATSGSASRGKREHNDGERERRRPLREQQDPRWWT